MSNVFSANNFTIQVGTGEARLIFADVRPGCQIPGTLFEAPMIGKLVGEAVISLQNARALRDLLVQHIKDDAPPMETPNV